VMAVKLFLLIPFAKTNTLVFNILGGVIGREMKRMKTERKTEMKTEMRRLLNANYSRISLSSIDPFHPGFLSCIHIV
jgi:hypothetical protein